VQIDLVKYYITNKQLVKLLDKHMNVEIPKGYRVIDARQLKKDEKVTKKSKL